MALLGSFAGCGDPLVDTGYRGVSRWQIQGEVVLDEGPTMDTTHLRLAVFWGPGDLRDDNLDHYSEQVSTSQAAQVPAPFVLNLFEAPPTANANGAAYVIGRVLAYLDLNQDGRRGLAEPIAGLDVPTALLYASAPLPIGQTPTSVALSAGFHRVLLPQLCNRPLPGPTTAGDCGVRLGRACQNDLDCHPGQCLQRDGIPWPGGACVVAEPPQGGCRPAQASYHPAQSTLGGPSGYYLKRCQADPDCARPTDRIAGTYVCDAGIGACVPGESTHVVVGADAPVNPFCGAP